MESSVSKLSDDQRQRVESFFNITLRPHQSEALASILNGKDTIVSLPTGSGKSLCFEALTTALGTENDIVIVVSPLAFLLQAEVKKLCDFGISASYIGNKKSYEMSDLKAGKFRYVLGNPEQFLTDDIINKILRNELYKERVRAIVFDEVHTAVSWGLGKDSQRAFRSYFSKVGDLRALFPGAAMLCLTATASRTTQAKITELFALTNPSIISKSPDRVNIRQFVSKVKDVKCLKWLVKLLETPAQCPRTIVYCRRLRDCSAIYNYFCSILGKNSTCLSERVFDMVHSKTPENVKNFIGTELTSTESKLRVVVATKVLGMGLDIKCDQVVHYGPPSSMDDYIQQMGRAGRDSDSQAHSILLYHGQQLRNVDSSMLNLVKSEAQCLRSLALSDYTSSVHTFEQKHCCCSFCANNCDCGQCEAVQNGFERYSRQELMQSDDVGLHDDDGVLSRTVSDEERQSVIKALYDLKDELDRKILSVGASFSQPALHHGLTTDIIHQILEELPNLYSIDDILSSCDMFNYETACHVVFVLVKIFDDIEVDIDTDDDEFVPP